MIFAQLQHKRRFLVLLFLFVLSPLSSAAAENRVVRVGVYENPPLVFKDPAGRFQGLALDMLRIVARKEDWQLQFVGGAWAECLQRLNRGEIDLLPVIAASSDRSKFCDFSREPLIINWGGVYVRSGSTINSLTDLKGKTVAFLDQDIYADVFRDMVDRFGLHVRMVLLSSYDAVLRQVETKKAAAGIVNRLFGLQKGRSFHVVKTPVIFHPINVVYAVSRGQNAILLQGIDHRLHELKLHPGSVYYQLLDTWFAGDRTVAVPFQHWKILFAVVGLLVVVLILAFILRRQVRTKTAQLHREIEERRDLEDTLRRSRQKYITLLDNLPQRIFFKNLNSVYIACNRVFAGDFGLLVNEVPGQSDFDLLPRETAEQYRADDFRVMESGRTSHRFFNFEQDGATLIMKSVKAPVFDGKGAVSGVLGIFWDVTMQMRGQELLRKSERRFRCLLNQASDAIFVSNREGRLIEVNYRACDTLGYSRDELLAMTVGDVDLLFSDGGRGKKIWDRLPEEGAVVLESVHQRKDGATFPVELSIGLLSTEEQPLILIIARDISARKAAEKSLHEVFEIINRSRSIAFRWRNVPGWPVDFVSDNVMQLCGYTANEFISEAIHYAKIIHPEDFGRVSQEIRQVETDKDCFDFVHEPYRIITRDGDLKWVSNSTHISRDEAGNVIFYQGVVEDISELRKMEERLFQADKMTTIAGLAAGVAHEINTPLSAILQSAQIIEQGLDAGRPANRAVSEECGVDLDKVQHYLKKRELDYFLTGIRESATKAAAIIHSLLDFSRPFKGEIEQVNLINLIDNTLKLARADYNLKKKYDIVNVTIHRDDDHGPPVVACVPMEIEQVILNLVKNAVQAMADAGVSNPRITIRTRCVGRKVRIEVQDNGPGMDEETRKHAFDPFFTTKETGAGTGLGLSVSYAIIHDKHGGDIRVKTEPGRGATFMIELPLNGQDRQ